MDPSKQFGSERQSSWRDSTASIREMIDSERADFSPRSGLACLIELTGSPSMTDRLCVNCTVAVLRALYIIGGMPAAGGAVAVACNSGLDSPRLTKAVLVAIAHSGHEPTYAGETLVAALVNYAQNMRIPAVMVYGPKSDTGCETIEYYSPPDSARSLDVDLLLSLTAEVL